MLFMLNILCDVIHDVIDMTGLAVGQFRKRVA